MTRKATTTTPTTTLSPLKTLNCDFEGGSTCNWKTASFKVTSPATNKLVPGMFFPFTDTSRHSPYGKVAYVFSPLRNSVSYGFLDGANPYPNMKICFGFNYYFYSNGPSVFALRMSKDRDGNEEEVTIFRGYGANEDVWRKGTQSLNFFC